MWIQIEEAKKIAADLVAAFPGADVRCWANEMDPSKGKCELWLRDARSGNTVLKTAKAGETAKKIMAGAKADLKGRAAATSRQVRAERAAN